MVALAPEFGFIARHFAPIAGEGALGLADDAALLAPRDGRELVFTADAMVEGVHFLPDDPPDTLGRKLLRVNLSDLAAMGADPRGVLLTLSVPPGREDGFFAAFASGLADDLARFGASLLGGDTTATPGPLTLSLTAIGDVPAGRAVRRGGARPGDLLLVTGTIGGGVLGLRALRDGAPDPDGRLARRYRLPEPRLAIGLREHATAAIDVSDGLLQDAGHVARASGAVLAIERDRVPLPPGTDESLRELCLAGGDDYELLVSCPPHRAGSFRSAAAATGTPLTVIGEVRAGEAGLLLLDARGHTVAPERVGWSHL